MTNKPSTNVLAIRTSKSGYSKAAIAVELGVYKSNVYRKLRRNSDKQKYHPVHAQEYTNDRKIRKRSPRKFTKKIKVIIEEKLKLY
jgi:IS30 family transposase